MFVQTTLQYKRPWPWQERLFNLAWLLVDTARRQGDLTLSSQDSTNLPPLSLSLSSKVDNSETKWRHCRVFFHNVLSKYNSLPEQVRVTQHQLCSHQPPG